MDFHYRLRYPSAPSEGRPPLLVLLHGKGANEEDIFSIAPAFDPRFAVIAIRAPHEMAPGFHRWYERRDIGDGLSDYPGDEVLHSRQFLIQAIKDAVMATGADPRRVFVLGFSQGGAMALALALTAPSLLRGAVSMAGRLLPAIAPLAAEPAALGHLTVMLQHGKEDEVVPLAESVSACLLLSELRVMLALREYPGGHTISPNMLRDARDFLGVQLDTLAG